MTDEEPKGGGNPHQLARHSAAGAGRGWLERAVVSYTFTCSFRWFISRVPYPFTLGTQEQHGSSTVGHATVLGYEAVCGVGVQMLLGVGLTCSVFVIARNTISAKPWVKNGRKHTPPIT